MGSLIIGMSCVPAVVCDEYAWFVQPSLFGLVPSCSPPNCGAAGGEARSMGEASVLRSEEDATPPTEGVSTVSATALVSEYVIAVMPQCCSSCVSCTHAWIVHSGCIHSEH
jgi:hypothetical protein